MKILLGLLLFPLLMLLSACGAHSEDELRDWVVEERNQTRPRVKDIPSPKKFVPELYANTSAVDPFSSTKLTQAFKHELSQTVTNSALITPELTRRKEPLESFSLDTMVLVGHLTKEGQPVALVKVDNLLYQVKPGNHLGQNYGKAIKITETQVSLREIVQDATGAWVERTATLGLQEKAK
jgi:type IV pilus assembly protein PilP